MRLIKITAVSYANTLPFIYGLKKSGLLNDTLISIDVPSVCAEKVINEKADIGLIPVGALQNIKRYQIISDYCIGSDGEVKSVLLLSQKPIDEINEIYLDYESLTSIELIKIISIKFWKKDYKWKNIKNIDINYLAKLPAVVVIGDKAMETASCFKYSFDLSSEWKRYTGLPFVFACWISINPQPENFIEKFNESLNYGINNIDKVIEESQTSYNFDLKKYYSENISYNFDEKKKQALSLFQDYLR